MVRSVLYIKHEGVSYRDPLRLMDEKKFVFSGDLRFLTLMLTGKKEFSTRRVAGGVVTRWGLINFFSAARENLDPFLPKHE